MFSVTLAVVLSSILGVLPTFGVKAKPAKDSAHYVVQIDRVTVEDMRLEDTLDVMLDARGRSVGGFVLKVGVESRFVEVEDILPGELLDSCQWEFFKPVQLNTIDKENYPWSLWQITGLSKMTPDSTQPVCLGFDRPVSIARLVVSSARAPEIPDTTVAVFFFWEDCRDNALSDASGQTLQVSQRVLDAYPVSIPAEADVFPTRLGTPRQCINPNNEYAPKRTVDFVNGGVEFKLKIGGATPDSSATDSL